MSTEYRTYEVTVPAGTAKTAGWTQDISFPPYVVDTITVRVPPGPRGTMGFSLGSSGTAIIPYNSGEWIVTDDEVVSLPLDGYFDSGSWTVFAYNTGSLDHTIYIRFGLSPVPAAGVGGGYTSSSQLSTA